MTHFRGGRDAISKDAYPEMEGFFADLAQLYRDELADLSATGCSYVQFDDTNLAYLCDEKMREGARALGEDSAELMKVALATASIRVVLKWPQRADPMAGIRLPSHRITGKTTRYDVFMTG